MRKSFYLLMLFLAMFFLNSRIFAGYSWQEIQISRVLKNASFDSIEFGNKKIIGIKEINKNSLDSKESCHSQSNSREIRSLLSNNEVFAAQDEKVKNALHLKIDKEYVTEIILRNGWAKMNNDAVSSYFKSRFEKAQQFARDNRLGVWSLCPLEINRSKIRGNFGGRMRNFKDKNHQFLGNISIGIVEEVLSGNEFRLKNGPIVKLQDVDIPQNSNKANSCFRENSRNYLSNLILGKEVRIEKKVNSREITDYKLERIVYINGESREFSINEQVITDGFGKSDFFAKIQSEVYKNTIGAWKICARDILNTNFTDRKIEISREIDKNCPIKGNISGTKKSPIKTYHTVLSGWYERIQSEQCFKSEEEADFAGFRKIK